MWDEPHNPEWEWTSAYCFGEDIIVFRRCPHCGRFMKCGEVWGNQEGEVTALSGWRCSRCGEVTPDWTRSA